MNPIPVFRPPASRRSPLAATLRGIAARFLVIAAVGATALWALAEVATALTPGAPF